MSKFKRFFYNIIYSLPFGLKGMNDLMFTQKSSSNSDDVGVHNLIKEKSLKKDLLNAEVTQEVEELRHMTYEVSKESKKYEYIGGGLATKKEDVILKEDIKKFSQENKLVCEDTLHELNSVDKNGEERYTIEFTYENVSKFKLEQFLTMIDVSINKKDISCVLHFSSIPNKYNVKSKPFISELTRIVRSGNQRHEILTDILKIGFITYKAHGEGDLIKYELVRPTFDFITSDKYEFTIGYKCNYVLIDDLTNKFKSETMQKKYDNKESKNAILDLTNYF